MEKSEAHLHGSKDDVQHLTPMEKIHGPMPPLKIGDIVLVRHRKIWVRAFLRKVTGSHWDHSALVIFAKNPEKGYLSNIIIEAIQYRAKDSVRRGTEVHKLDKYLNRPDLYDVGIKRFEGIDDEMRSRARSFALMNVDAPYYRLPFFDFLFAALSKRVAAYVLRRQRFNCSGLVQKAYWNAADWSERHKFAFRDLGDSPIELQELVTPADIAKSDVCAWIWNER